MSRRCPGEPLQSLKSTFVSATRRRMLTVSMGDGGVRGESAPESLCQPRPHRYTLPRRRPRRLHPVTVRGQWRVVPEALPLAKPSGWPACGRWRREWGVTPDTFRTRKLAVTAAAHTMPRMKKDTAACMVYEKAENTGRSRQRLDTPHDVQGGRQRPSLHGDPFGLVHPDAGGASAHEDGGPQTLPDDQCMRFPWPPHVLHLPALGGVLGPSQSSMPLACAARHTLLPSCQPIGNSENG